MTLLAVKKITAGYGVQSVLFDVSMEVDHGEVVAVIGPNGAGKTTLLRAIVGIVQPKTGDIMFKDRSILGMEPEHVVRLGLGWVPQEDNIFSSMTVRENLEMGSYTLRKNMEGRIEEVCGIFPALADRMGQTAGNLSGGQRQMLAVGRGLMVHPDLLLLDEPTAGLAPTLVQMMLARIKEITNRMKRAVVLVTQTIDALRLCQRGYLLSAGEIRFADSTDELLGNQDVRDLYFGGSSASSL